MKYLVTGGKRTGTTLLCAILANAGANFGFPRNREWFRGSGDYEHEIMIANYKHLKRSRLYQPFSDSFAARQQKKIVDNMGRLLEQVDYIKYPPLSEYLPIHIKRAGYDPRLLVTIRKFNDFALSAIAKSGGVFGELKSIYLETYKTHLLNLSLYGGCAVLYEDIIDKSATDWAERLGTVTGISAAELLRARDEIIKPTTSKNNIGEVVIDQACEDLYATYKTLEKRVFAADEKKQHRGA